MALMTIVLQAQDSYSSLQNTPGVCNFRLDLSNWTFSAAGKPLKREHRDYWKNRWLGMGMPLNK